MDENTELLLATAGRTTRWEDEEKATNDVDQLREEFRRRLYGNGPNETRGGLRIGEGDRAPGGAGLTINREKKRRIDSLR